MMASLTWLQKAFPTIRSAFYWETVTAHFRQGLTTPWMGQRAESQSVTSTAMAIWTRPRQPCVRYLRFARMEWSIFLWDILTGHLVQPHPMQFRLEMNGLI